MLAVAEYKRMLDYMHRCADRSANDLDIARATRKQDVLNSLSRYH